MGECRAILQRRLSVPQACLRSAHLKLTVSLILSWRKRLKSVSLIDPSQDPRWDDFVRSHPYGLICHLSGWKEVLERAFSHIKGRFLVLLDPADGEIRAGLPVYLVSSLLTGIRLVSIPFATLCDPLASSRTDMELLLGAASKLAADVKAPRIEIRTLASAHLMGNSGYRKVDFYKHHFLTLDEPAERLLKRFHYKSVRSTLNRCQRNGLELTTDCSYEALQRFFNFHVSVRKRLGLPPQPFRLFENLWREFAPEGMLRILWASHRGEPIASIIVFRFKDRVSWEYVGERQEFRYQNPTHFLVWEAIKQACAEGYKIFDFGRTSTSNLGLMDFKRRWGTTVTDLPQYWLPANGTHFPDNAEKSLQYRFLKTLIRKIPEPFLSRLGELCYRHMG